MDNGRKKLPVTERKLKRWLRDSRVEVVNGEIVELPHKPFLGYDFITPNYFALINLTSRLGLYVGTKKLGWAYTSLHHVIFVLARENGEITDAPLSDVAVVDYELSPQFKRAQILIFPKPPLLAVEVVSKVDNAGYLLRKTRDFLRHGTRQVWIVYPEVKEVHQYRRESQDHFIAYTGNSTIDAEDLFLGFKLSLNDLFREIPMEKSLPITQG